MIPDFRAARNKPVHRLRLQLVTYPYVHKHRPQHYLGDLRGPKHGNFGKKYKNPSRVTRAGAGGGRARRRRLTGIFAIEQGPMPLRAHVAGQQFDVQVTFLKDAREDPLDRTENLQGGFSPPLMLCQPGVGRIAGKSLWQRPMLEII